MYALDMNIEKAEDVLMHKRLLQMAGDPATRPAVEVRPVVQVVVMYHNPKSCTQLIMTSQAFSYCYFCLVRLVDI